MHSSIHRKWILRLCLTVASACQDEQQAPDLARPPPCGRGFAFECSSSAQFARLADEALNVHRLWRLGDAEWSETLVDFSDRAFNEQARLRCGESLGSALTAHCGYEVRLIVEANGDLGVIRYSEASDLENAREPACIEYSDCIVSGYVGKSIRLPTKAREVVPLKFYVQALRRQDLSYNPDDPTFLRLTLEIMQEDYKQMMERDWRSDGRLRFAAPNLASEIAYMERKLATAGR